MVDLLPIIQSDGASIDFSEDFSFGNVDFSGSVYRFEKITATGSVKKNGETAELNAVIVGSFETDCARCMAPIGETFSFDVCESFPFVPQADISDIVLETILTNLFIVYLCDEDCKGICPTCGKNVADGQCGCSNEYTDSRFDILKNLDLKDEV